MISTRRFGQTLGTAILALVVCWLAPPTEATAEDGVKRSPGTMSRSAGSMNRASSTRRGGSLSSDRRGSTTESRTTRTTSKPSFRKPSKDSKSAKAGDKSGVRKASKQASDSDPDEDSILGRAPKTDEDFEAIEAEYSARTLGRACMYGLRGEVIYRPAGARCRGDEPTPAAKR